jgi:hypothetical protein
LLPNLSFIRPSWGRALGDVEPGDDLDAGRELVLDRQRRLGDLAQLAVDPEADAVVVLVGLEVQVGGAQVDRVDQHLLQEADDRRVLDVARDLFVGLARDVVGDVEFEVAGGQRLHLFRSARARGLENLRELVVLDDHPLGRELGRELDALGRFLVGRVGAADEDAVAALAEHDDLVLRRELRVDDVLRQLDRVDRVQVEQRQGQRGRQRVRQIGGRNGAGADDRADEAGALFPGASNQLLGGLGVELARVDQHPRHAGEGGMRCFGEGIQPVKARSVREETDDHRRFTLGCKRRAPRAVSTIHAGCSRPGPLVK